MKSLIQKLKAFHEDESGHVVPGAANLIPAAGAIVLTYGATDANDTIIIIGGVALALGLLVASVLRHREIDYEIYSRLEKLEGKK